MQKAVISWMDIVMAPELKSELLLVLINLYDLIFNVFLIIVSIQFMYGFQKCSLAVTLLDYSIRLARYRNMLPVFPMGKVII